MEQNRISLSINKPLNFEENYYNILQIYKYKYMCIFFKYT